MEILLNFIIMVLAGVIAFYIFSFTILFVIKYVFNLYVADWKELVSLIISNFRKK